MKLKLWENEIPYFNPEADTPNSMSTYLIDTDKPLPCIVVLPGGGYSNRAAHEGEPIARFFNEQGMHAVVVDYRVAPNRFPAPLADAQRAIKLVRANAEVWKVDPNRIVTLGFSAGGHLCASTAVLEDVVCAGNFPTAYTPDEIDKQSARPDGAIPCYAVISLTEAFGHPGSGRNLLGEKYKYEAEYFSLENHVSDNTPPCCLWHTSDDSVVNVKNSLVFAERLRDHNIPFEMHIYPHGRHGLGLAKDFEDVKTWADHAARWVERNI